MPPMSGSTWCWHRDASKSPFLCGEYRFPQQDSFLEWQANEGAAEILMPWRQMVELVLECPPDPDSRESLIRAPAAAG